MPKQESYSQPAPHSWAIPNWPPHVYPHSSEKGRYLVRCHRHELMQAGAITRIGRDLVILGDGFCKWMKSKSGEVTGFKIAPNAPKEPTIWDFDTRLRNTLWSSFGKDTTPKDWYEAGPERILSCISLGKMSYETVKKILGSYWDTSGWPSYEI